MGILMGVFAGVTALSVIFTVFIMRRRSRKGLSSERHSCKLFFSLKTHVATHDLIL